MKTCRMLGLVAVLSISGCATCRDHPVACSVAGALVFGSVAIAVANHNPDSGRDPIRERMSPCEPQGITPCAK